MHANSEYSRLSTGSFLKWFYSQKVSVTLSNFILVALQYTGVTKALCYTIDMILQRYALIIVSQIWDSFHEQFFHCNSNLLEISFCSHSSCSEVIAMKFCTWLDNCAAVACAKFCGSWYSTMELHEKQFSIEFELLWENLSWNGPLVGSQK